jgi:hypothetical protein
VYKGGKITAKINFTLLYQSNFYMCFYPNNNFAVSLNFGLFSSILLFAKALKPDQWIIATADPLPIYTGSC